MSDELFTIPETKPDALTAARNRLGKAIEALEDALDLQFDHEDAWPVVIDAQSEVKAARKAVAALETAAMKSL